MAASKRILKKAARKLEGGGACAPLAGSILANRGIEKRKAKRAAKRRKSTRKASRRAIRR